MAGTLDDLTPKQREMLELRLKQRRARAPLPTRSDDENLVLAESVEAVDELLAKFYGRFPWPWEASKFDYLTDEDFERRMLNQDVGDYRHQTFSESPRVWVGGCGTNQALQTALRFRGARVIGSDVSTKSLEIARRNAAALDLTNLELREESLNRAEYVEQFDYVICTGVIHHNADPRETLERLSASLKPGGIMELMVYNRYHRLVTSSFQKAVRLFGSSAEQGVDFDAELSLARKIIENISARGTLERAFTQYMDYAESDLADLLIQPVEHSYTVESLEWLASGCGLEYIMPCISLYAKSLATYLWDLSFDDRELQERYDALPDSRRWQITNLLLHDKSPLLWFYFRRPAPGQPRQTEREVCERFLRTKFVRSATTQRSYIRTEDGAYRLSAASVPYPLAEPDASVRHIYEAVDGRSTMGEVFERLGVSPDFHFTNQARILLSTAAFPYLTAVND